LINDAIFAEIFSECKALDLALEMRQAAERSFNRACDSSGWRLQQKQQSVAA
jgi:hypothetical protein